MKKIAMVVSFIGLAGVVLPPVLFFMDKMPLGMMKGWLLGATLVWFASTPLWMERKGG